MSIVFTFTPKLIQFPSKDIFHIFSHIFSRGDFYLPTTAYTVTPFCSSNLLFIQQLLDILYSFKEKKKKTDQYYVLKEILYEILSLVASIQGEKIVNNNLQLDRLKLLSNEVLIALSSSKNNTDNTI
jgi:hypothetical protein